MQLICQYKKEYISRKIGEKFLDDYYNLLYLNDSYQQYFSNLPTDLLSSNSYLGLSLYWLTFNECPSLNALWVHFWNICGNFPYGKPIMNDIIRLKETKCRHKICARFFPIICCIIDWIIAYRCWAPCKNKRKITPISQ